MNIKHFSSAATSVIAIATVALAAMSCQRTDLDANSQDPSLKGSKGNDVISITIGGETGMSKSTKGGFDYGFKGISPVVLSDSQGSSLLLQAQSGPILSGINDGLYPATKGQMVTTGNVNTERDGKITVVAYSAEDDFKCWFDPTVIKFKEWKDPEQTVSRWEFADTLYHWPSSDLRFFAWSPSDVFKDSLINAAEGIFSFNYTMPKPDPLTKRDAEAMPDLLVSNMLLSCIGPDNDTEADLVFDHALAALRFEIGRNNGIKVKSIKLENILSQGKSTYSAADKGNVFTWSEVKAPETYIQSFDGGWSVDPDYTYAPGTGDTGKPVGDTTATFMVIPQISGKTGAEPVKLSIEMDLGADDVRTFQTSLNEGNASWEAGKVYTYIVSINSNKELDIEVRETFTGNNVKSDVNVENTGGKATYVRMNIVANWVDGLGHIIRPCNWTETGTLEGKAWGAEGDKWVLGPDGWFYYKYVLKPGPYIYTHNLFDKYDPGYPQFVGTKLLMEVMAQGVEYDPSMAKVKAAWGEEAAALLTTEFDE